MMGGKLGIVKKLGAVDRKDEQPRAADVGQVWTPDLLANSSRQAEEEG